MRFYFTTIILLCFSFMLAAQTVEVSPYDSISWENPPNYLKNSRFYQLDIKGHLRLIGGFKNGKKDGVLYFFWTGGVTFGLGLEEHYKDGVLNGFWTNIKESGYYKNGLKTGVWVDITSSSETRTTYKKGKRNGTFEETTELFVTKGYFKNDKKTGVWTDYQKTPESLEKISQDIYKDDQLIRHLNCTKEIPSKVRIEK